VGGRFQQERGSSITDFGMIGARRFSLRDII
jgi:hypothetical protein